MNAPARIPEEQGLNLDVTSGVTGVPSGVSAAVSDPLPYRCQILQRANARLPLTAEGLPVGYYRTDLIPTTYLPAQEEMQALKAAYADLSFEYGYPTLPDGRPFWHKLEFEPGLAYGAFTIYLESINEGPRELSKLAANDELLSLINRAQPLKDGQLWTETALSRLLYEYGILYCWRPRAKAHDIYKEAAYRHLRLKRQSSVEDEDYLLATGLLKQLRDKVLSVPKFFEDMKPRDAADLLSKLVAMRRVSVGLPAAGPLSQKEAPEDTTFEMIMRSLSQKAGQGATYEHQGESASKNILGEVLTDPEASRNLQEVIIRVSKVHQQHLPNPNDRFNGRAFKGRGRSQEIITSDDLAAPYDIEGAPGENLRDLVKGAEVVAPEAEEEGKEEGKERVEGANQP